MLGPEVTLSDARLPPQHSFPQMINGSSGVTLSQARSPRCTGHSCKAESAALEAAGSRAQAAGHKKVGMADGWGGI